ncbi:MAG: glycosyltransferase family 4 protein [Actinomycetota bacterium]|nr:glycosyltransferase family 4 protein [Actinomycetota bacterium]
MRVNLHDFSGHPFQVQLARNLASRGHEVLHQYSSQYETGHGRLRITADDPGTLRIEALTAAVPLVKYSPLGRARFEMAYARAWRGRLDRERFDVIIACNVPLFALARMRRYFARSNQPWVLWHQDVYSMGVAAEADRRLPRPLAALVRQRVERTERAQVTAADAVVAIGEPFLEQYARWSVSRDNVHVIPNWAPLNELLPGDRDNPWARRHDIPDGPIRLMYAGTLGRKHNSGLLLELLDAVRSEGLDAMLIVVSEGVGADDLALAASGRGDVRILGYQPAEDLSDVLATGDVMIALLEPDAAKFSVPSKVLSYLSAGRPIVALVPEGNPCAADVLAAGGYVAAPSREGARQAGQWLSSAVGAGRDALVALGIRSRNLADFQFDLDRIGSQFEAILAKATRPDSQQRRSQVLAANPGGTEGKDL